MADPSRHNEDDWDPEEDWDGPPPRTLSRTPPHTPTGSLLRRTRVRVLLPLPLGGAFDYAWTPGFHETPDEGTDPPAPGTFVTVPLGRRMVAGCVWDGPAQPGEVPVDDTRLKDIEAILDAPPLPEIGRRFVDWVARYCLADPGAVLRMAMSVPQALMREAPAMGLVLGDDPPEALGLKMTKARRAVLDAAADRVVRPAKALAEAAEAGIGVVQGLAKAGALLPMALPRQVLFPTPDPDRPGAVLSEEQGRAAALIKERVTAGRYAALLLDGVTGSGKTEVYFEAIAEALRQDRQVLVLLPEIALTPEWLDRFEGRFGVRPASWHSEMKPVLRRRTWRAVAEGEARVVVGARSALFLPFGALGLIVVDEEHESAFKQEEGGVLYHGRDMAVARAHLGDIPILLASATPSIETLVNVRAGRYERLHLPNRHGRATLPEIELVDLVATPPAPGRWLAPPVEKALIETVTGGDQALLFLNRRGYAPLTICGACGFRVGCPNCSGWLVDHRLLGRLRCHHCGFEAPRPSICPDCGAADSFRACGPGVERVAEEVAMLLPEARFMVVSGDTVGSPAQAAEIVRSIRAHEVDVVIGTQMIAKGHNFPKLTFVGVVDGDLGLAGGDLRAAERTYQLLSQVGGRAGRGEKPGRVLIQTHAAAAPVFAALKNGDRERFYETEIAARRAAGQPPFRRLAALIVSAPDAERADAIARDLARTAPLTEKDLRILGPAEPAYAVLRGRHRRRFLVNAPRSFPLQECLGDWLGRVRVPSACRVVVDIDPYGFL
ncbi:MAG: primosomal protein N' [Alphaproteobacteria bacterium]|nr:primosomal protein N' [Alphaproteobacteria bacterium]